MKSAWILFRFGSVLVLGAGARLAAVAPTAPAPSVHSELLQLLETDAKVVPKAEAPKPAPPPAAKDSPQAAAVAPAPVTQSSPTATLGEPFSPELWSYFTDTGILASDHGKKVTKELTFGPCTDGELLNQRFYW
jgi:hypothetical protein